MKIYEFNCDCFPKIDEKIVLCLGFFDGLHLGHQKIVNEAKKYGKKVGVLTFDNSVYNFLNKTNELITPTNQKIKILEKMGVDYFFEIEMSKELIKLSAKEFLLKLKSLNPEICVCGLDYTFGKNKEGKVADLCREFNTKVVDFEKYNNQKIGTQKIFEAIKYGEMEDAAAMLGRYYSVRGRVEEGLRNGRKMGYPTANIFLKNYCKPLEGVYYGYAVVDDEKYPAIASFGTHPTLDELDSAILEIHIFNFNENIYDEIIDFEFVKYVRSNQHFTSEYELADQLSTDKIKALEFFKKKNW